MWVWWKFKVFTLKLNMWYFQCKNLIISQLGWGVLTNLTNIAVLSKRTSFKTVDFAPCQSFAVNIRDELTNEFAHFVLSPPFKCDRELVLFTHPFITRLARDKYCSTHIFFIFFKIKYFKVGQFEEVKFIFKKEK